jgi:DNA adenine methylase
LGNLQELQKGKRVIYMLHQSILLKAENEITPFLKWPGGKRWFIQNYSHLLPTQFNKYYEPFLGGGAVFFYLQPKEALLSDINPELIATYKGIQENWKSIKRSLQYRQRLHSEDYYYKVRDRNQTQLLQTASRMIYLNRTCFNGIYRVNLDGQFNVPIGTKTNVYLDSDNFEKVSELLQNADFQICDFEKTINKAKINDLVFADPPYTVRHNLNGFVKYNETLFSWDDQLRLAETLISAKERGVKIVSTNANHTSIRNLYTKKGFTLKTVSRYSSIAATGNSRKQFEELVILSHPNKK